MGTKCSYRSGRYPVPESPCASVIFPIGKKEAPPKGFIGQNLPIGKAAHPKTLVRNAFSSGTKQTVVRLAEGWGVSQSCRLPGRSNLRRVKKSRKAAQRGAGMIKILHDLLLFSCLAAFVTGIVVAAAALLI